MRIIDVKTDIDSQKRNSEPVVRKEIDDKKKQNKKGANKNS